MRGFLITTAASLGLAFGAVAMAEPGPTGSETTPAAAEDSTTTEAPETDCSALEGEAKANCEAGTKSDAPAKAEQPAAAAAEGKGGKAKRSNTNRMERVHEDE